jgi:DNA-binding MarR family transcriptional regulator/GNAT superfamily N-acetyltransferase
MVAYVNQLIDIGRHLDLERSMSPAAVPSAVASPETVTAADIAAVRQFNRLYTREIGALDREHLGSPFSLGELRVLYELAHGHDGEAKACTASSLAMTLALDAGYLSRLLRDFTERGLVARTRSASDARQQHLRLTAKGRRTFTALEAKSAEAVARLLAPIRGVDRQQLVSAMRTIERLLLSPSPPGVGDGAPAYILRQPQVGDLGWVIARHGALYAREYGWNASFEVLVAKVATAFFEAHDPSCERGWIAERDGPTGRENIGSVFLVKHPERPGVAKLRMLLLEPSARGIGLGKRLVQECTRYARACGYHTITLWTNHVLVAARGIYAAEGYRLIHAEPFSDFGRELISETWELAL